MSLFKVIIFMHGTIEVEADGERRAVQLADDVTTLTVDTSRIGDGESASVFFSELDLAGNEEAVGGPGRIIR